MLVWYPWNEAPYKANPGGLQVGVEAGSQASKGISFSTMILVYWVDKKWTRQVVVVKRTKPAGQQLAALCFLSVDSVSSSCSCWHTFHTMTDCSPKPWTQITCYFTATRGTAKKPCQDPMLQQVTHQSCPESLRQGLPAAGLTLLPWLVSCQRLFLHRL